MPVGVEIGVNLDGSFAVKLDSPSGLLNLTKPDVLDLEVHSLGFAWADEVPSSVQSVPATVKRPGGA